MLLLFAVTIPQERIHSTFANLEFKSEYFDSILKSRQA